jgi:hypothetical protein
VANFAGVHDFASGGTLSQSGVLAVRVDRRGRLRSGWCQGVALDASGRRIPTAARRSRSSRGCRRRTSARPRRGSAGRADPAGGGRPRVTSAFNGALA